MPRANKGVSLENKCYGKKHIVLIKNMSSSNSRYFTLPSSRAQAALLLRAGALNTAQPSGGVNWKWAGLGALAASPFVFRDNLPSWNRDIGLSNAQDSAAWNPAVSSQMTGFDVPDVQQQAQLSRGFWSEPEPAVTATAVTATVAPAVDYLEPVVSDAAAIATTLTMEKGQPQAAAINGRPAIVRFLASGQQTAVYDVEGSDYVLKVPFTELGPQQNTEAIDKAVAAGVMNAEIPAHVKGKIIAPRVTSDMHGLEVSNTITDERDLSAATLARKIRTVSPQSVKKTSAEKQAWAIEHHLDMYRDWKGSSPEQKTANGDVVVDYMRLQEKMLKTGLYSSDAHSGNIGYDSSGELKLLDSGGITEIERLGQTSSGLNEVVVERLGNVEKLVEKIGSPELSRQAVRAIGSWREASRRTREQTIKAYHISSLDFVMKDYLLMGDYLSDLHDEMIYIKEDLRPIMDKTIDGLTEAFRRIADAKI